MQRFTNAPAVWAAAAVALIAGASTLHGHVTQQFPATPLAAATATVTQPAATVVGKTTTAAAAVAKSTAAATTTAAAAVAAISRANPAMPPSLRMTAPATSIAVLSEQELRAKIKWVPVRWGGEKTRTLDEASRVILALAAAEHADLEKVGLSFHDVYGVIEAETSWIPRKGMGRNGVASTGLAQFEPRTAKGYGLKNPNDPVQAVYAAARYMKDGAEWAADRIDHLPLTPEQRAEKIREGVSVYYNLSIKGRNKWDGLNTANLPFETQRHIRNVRAGAREALEIAEAIAI